MNPNLLITLHVLCVATWWGVPLTSPGMVRRGLAGGEKTFKAATITASRMGMIAGISGILSLVTGLVLVFNQGGFSAVAPTIHVSLTLVIVMLGISFGLMKPTGGKLLAAAESWSDQTPTAVAPLLKRMAMGGGILQLLWMVVLVLMSW